ncbi:hypothetical protein EDEG_00440 [Edhazardia aedis USNM 41457]|uniref:Uncharacterized protein n=1 Tax=Edhazardia aedis (strain USNM 41457) TaxID=1003232 RepID=J9DJB6_EDHAE|nr:hypothetical protein EDEG_00440 [Edhazardia aedis USNM 41457]|eukprot:EJW01472.1 hypothetical protein EDEG_00440 [Edhazardia aedis USNM 41457]
MLDNFSTKFFSRIDEICKKYSVMDDQKDDQIDLENLEIIKGLGESKKIKSVPIGSLYTKKYLRDRDVKIIKSGLRSFDFVYDEIFDEKSFDEIFEGLVKNKNIT